MTSARFFILALLLGSLTILGTGCTKKKSSNKSQTKTDTDTQTQNPVNPTPNPAPAAICDAPGTQDGNGQIRDYYRVPVVGVGDGFSQFTTSWSSKLDMSAVDQKIFVTDTRLRIRAVVKPAPSRLQNPKCKFDDPYLRLKFNIGLKGFNSTQYSQVISIPGTHVDTGDYSQCTAVKDFTTIPLNDSNIPLVLEIFGVEWDRCNSGFSASKESPACAFNQLWDFNCYQLELQVVTDHTYNF